MIKLLQQFAALGLLLLPACTKPADKAPPVRDEDNPIMKLPEAYADKDGLVSLTFDIAKFTDPRLLT